MNLAALGSVPAGASRLVGQFLSFLGSRREKGQKYRTCLFLLDPAAEQSQLAGNGRNGAEMVEGHRILVSQNTGVTEYRCHRIQVSQNKGVREYRCHRI